MGTVESLPDLRHQQIARLAYEIWQQNGQPAGSAEHDWLLAERMVDSMDPMDIPFGSFSLEADEA